VICFLLIAIHLLPFSLFFKAASATPEFH